MICAEIEANARDLANEQGALAKNVAAFSAPVNDQRLPSRGGCVA
jgi:hypothetical protein